MASGRSGGGSFLTSVPITRPICPSNDFQSVSLENQSDEEGFSGSVTKTGLIFFLNEFVKGNEHRENIFGEFKFIFSCSNICYSYEC